MDTKQHKRKKPTKIEEMTKEQIRQAILKKRECNAKAQHIVESLLERSVTEKYFLQCLPDINQTHFEDIIEERSIIHLCGYPICQKPLLTQDIPKQKYRISLKTNKVYDITARKNFCSNTCYNAAIYVKKQMLTSPLWFREYEDMPKFNLLNVETLGGMGEEIDVTLVDRIKISEKSFTSLNDFAQANSIDVPNNETSPIKNVETKEGEQKNESTKKKVEEVANGLQSVSLHDASNSYKPELIQHIESEAKTKRKLKNQLLETVVLEQESQNLTEKAIKKPAPNPLNIVGEIVEKPERKIDPILMVAHEPLESKREIKKCKVIPKKQPLLTVLTVEVEKCLAEWFTLDTMLLLFGDEKVREMVADKGECIKDYLNNYAKGIFYSSNAYDQYQALCKKLNMLELEDRKFDNDMLKRETKPLPDYTMLQEESKKMQLKVKAFFSGEMEISEPTAEVTVDPTESNDENITNLPLVDKNSRNALRRRIVCHHLNKVLPDLLRSLGLLSLHISPDVRLLVNTFKLKANNIMFKPIQWNLIAIIFIKLLSLRDKRLEYLLEQPTAYEHMQLLLLSYKQDGGYLERLISWLTDIDRLLETNDTQLTIE